MAALRLGALLCCLGNALHLLDLDKSSNWILSNPNGSIRVQVANASSTHLNLMKAGVLKGSPYYRDNEMTWAWVTNETWKYSTSFLSSPEMLAHRRQVLLCQIDTLAMVVLNGKSVGNTTNMFVQYEFDLTGLLRGTGTKNTLEVHIFPALAYGAREAKKYPYPVPESVYYHSWAEGARPDDGGTGEGTYTHRNFVRKAGSDFGWDWGPAFVPCGITRLALATQQAASLDGLTVQQRHEAGRVTVEVETHMAVLHEHEVRLVARLVGPPENGRVASTATWAGTARAGKVAQKLEFEVPSPLLWWPAGMGGQPLYELEVRLKCISGALGPDGIAEPETDAGVLRRRIGLRTVELVQEPLPGGASFFFRVNGADVFAKGANLIPFDVFAPRDPEEAEWVLRSAADAHMNMVRVWGGGVYQADAFYDLADELGIMLWQEMMFACALYPRHQEFLDSVTMEVEQQVLRLQHHASLVLWGGNNENELAMDWYERSRLNRDLYVRDYLALYVDTALAALRRIDSKVAFVDSSPSNGASSFWPYTKRWGNAQDNSRGDVHYYNYTADCEEPDFYPRARFISEHGFQSFPSFLTYQPVLQPWDYWRNSSELFRRQRHGGGQEQVEDMVGRHLKLPPVSAADPKEQQEVFDHYLYLTQVQQARCYETALVQWRRLRSDPEVRTMGVLYWQLNDIWPGPSWSSIEHTGSWRLAHSAVRRSFAPVLVSLVLEEQRLVRAFLTSDLTVGLTALLRLRLRRFAAGKHGEGAHEVASFNLTVKNGTVASTAVQLDDALRASGYSPATCFLYLEGETDEGLPRPLAAHAFLAPLKDAELPPVRLSTSRPRKLGPNRASFILTADNTAVHVAVESSEVAGRFMPNGMLMLPNTQVEVEFLGRSDFQLASWAAGLRLRSLRDTYKEDAVPAPSAREGAATYL